MSLSEGDLDKRYWRTIVGVVREVKERGYDYAPKPVTYVTIRQAGGWSESQLMVRAAHGHLKLY